MLSIMYLSLFCYGCKNSLSEAGSKYNKKLLFELSKEIVYSKFKLELVSTLMRDTLNGDWEDDIYGSPLILKQTLKFFELNKEIKTHRFPIGYVTKTTIVERSVKLVKIPILEICVLNGKENLFYVSGSDFCNGVGCPEFIGIYKMTGEIIYEGISNQSELSKNYLPLDSISALYEININHNKQCENLLGLWNRK
ncbi:MAG: hypothetical protein WBP33_12675 [Saprospiraceae bacterium]|nr:hypothetical protein [Candidatus Vicinibacter proximus]